MIFEDPRVPAAHREQLRRLYGLDRPLLVQYGAWLRAVTLKGEWGSSILHHRPVTAVLAEALPNTLLLALAALAVEYFFGLLLGATAARRLGSPRDHLVRVLSLVVYSLPAFWLGLMVVLLFAHLWPLFPASHLHAVGAERMSAGAFLLDLLHHLVLPALALGLPAAAGLARFVRGSLAEALSQEFVRAARGKGLSELRVVWLHALRHAAAPLAQLFGLSFSFLLSGALAAEVVFSWPGIGRVTYEALLGRDYPVLLAATALSGSLVVIGSLVADLLQAWADPRVRHA